MNGPSRSIAGHTRVAAVVGALVSLALLAVPTRASAQSPPPLEIQVEAGVDPDTVTVGQPFRSALRVVLPEGFSVEFQPLAAGDSVEATEPPRILEQTAGGVAALYELVPWVTGDSLTASVAALVTGPDGEVTEHTLPLAMPFVASVLPAADEDVAPKPLKPLFVPPSSKPFPWWWLALAAAVAAALLYAWWRSRRSPAAVSERDARTWALSELDELVGPSGTGIAAVERYRRSSWVLRGYLARVDDRLGTDLTTGEIVKRARGAGMGEGDLKALNSLLEAADRVKFSAGHPATDVGAEEAVTAIREMVMRYPPSESVDGTGKRAA